MFLRHGYVAGRRRAGQRRAAGLLTGLSLACLVSCAAYGSPSQPDDSHWNKTLVSVRMAGVPLRDALARLGRAHGRSVFLDRRVDPSRPVEINVRTVPLIEAIARIASQHRLGSTRLGPVAYVGPDFASARLRTLAALRWADVEKLGRSSRTKLSTPIVLAWPELASPRSIFQQISKKSGVAIDDLDSVPHDLWPAGRLPALPPVDLLTLIGNGLDLTFAVSPDRRSVVHLVPISVPVVIERRYSVRTRPQGDYQALIGRIPNASVDVGRRQIRVRGRVEDHELVARWIDGESPVGPAPEQGTASARADDVVQRHSLKVRNQPLSRVVHHLVDQLAVDIRIDESAVRGAGLSIDVPVDVDVRDMPLDDLLQQLVAPVGLRVVRTGEMYWIVPAR